MALACRCTLLQAGQTNPYLALPWLLLVIEFYDGKCRELCNWTTVEALISVCRQPVLVVVAVVLVRRKKEGFTFNSQVFVMRQIKGFQQSFGGPQQEFFTG